MAYGVEFYNTSGKTQLASNQSNYYLAEKGSVAVGTTGVFVNVTPTVAFDALAVAFDIPSGQSMAPKTIYPTTQPGGTTIAFRRQAVGSTGTLYWYAFRSYRALVPATSGWGMEIYNADGTVAFSTKQPKVLKYVKIPVTNYPLFTTSVPAGRTWAFLAYGVVRHIITVTAPMDGGAEPVPCYPMARDNGSNQVAISTVTRCGRFTLLGEYYNGGVLAVDVTNY